MSGASKSFRALNRLAKWRSVLAGWQLGTRPKGDPECDAVRDQRELLLLIRAELNALAALCLEKRLFTAEEWDSTLAREADELSASLAERFPGFRATDVGLEMDSKVAAATTKGWRP